jgi:hypothetical protein
MSTSRLCARSGCGTGASISDRAVGARGDLLPRRDGRGDWAPHRAGSRDLKRRGGFMYIGIGALILIIILLIIFVF